MAQWVSALAAQAQGPDFESLAPTYISRCGGVHTGNPRVEWGAEIGGSQRLAGYQWETLCQGNKVESDKAGHSMSSSGSVHIGIYLCTKYTYKIRTCLIQCCWECKLMYDFGNYYAAPHQMESGNSVWPVYIPQRLYTLLQRHWIMRVHCCSLQNSKKKCSQSRYPSADAVVMKMWSKHLV